MTSSAAYPLRDERGPMLKAIAIGLGAIGGSALTDPSIAVPEGGTSGIPVTYVPARNTIFLSIALGLAEVLGAHDLAIGVNALDYSGYPDCRPEFVQAFERLATAARAMGFSDVRGGPLVRSSYHAAQAA